jgi:hypothetical protein
MVIHVQCRFLPDTGNGDTHLDIRGKGSRAQVCFDCNGTVLTAPGQGTVCPDRDKRLTSLEHDQQRDHDEHGLKGTSGILSVT